MDVTIKKLAKIQGKKLAFLLAASKMNEEQQQQWIAILPKMSLEQIDRLVDILENQFCAEGFSKLDNRLEKELLKIKDSTSAKFKESDNKALKQLDTLVSDI